MDKILTTEILEENGFVKDAKLNVSPEYRFTDENGNVVLVTLNQTSDREQMIYCYNYKEKYHTELANERAGYVGSHKDFFYVYELNQLMKLAKVNHWIYE